MTKYFRVAQTAALTTALLAGFALPSFAQTAPATASPAGEMAPATPDTAKPASTVKKAKPAHKHHVAAKPATAPSK